MHNRNFLSAVLLAILSGSNHAFAGGSIGGSGGWGASGNADFVSLMNHSFSQPELGLDNIVVPQDEFRRARARLSTFDEAVLVHEGKPLSVIKHQGGITDKAVNHQILPKE